MAETHHVYGIRAVVDSRICSEWRQMALPSGANATVLNTLMMRVKAPIYLTFPAR